MSTKVLAGDLNVGDKFTWKGRTYEVMDVSEDFGVIHVNEFGVNNCLVSEGGNFNGYCPVTFVERSFP